MADPLRRVMDEVRVSAEAAWAREEDLAADDLAFSLRQDGRLGDVLRRWPGVELRLDEDAWTPVTELGPDHLVLKVPRSTLVPIGRVAAFRSDASAPPALSHIPLAVRLRRLARREASVHVGVGSSTYRGVLRAVTEDHLLLGGEGRELLIPAAGWDWIRPDPVG